MTAMPPPRATMKDVAALAGVSPKTVSNVVTGTVAVREETKLRAVSYTHLTLPTIYSV